MFCSVQLHVFGPGCWHVRRYLQSHAKVPVRCLRCASAGITHVHIYACARLTFQAPRILASVLLHELRFAADESKIASEEGTGTALLAIIKVVKTWPGVVNLPSILRYQSPALLSDLQSVLAKWSLEAPDLRPPTCRALGHLTPYSHRSVAVVSST